MDCSLNSSNQLCGHRFRIASKTLVSCYILGSIHFLEGRGGGGGWAGGIPMSMNVKSPSPPFIFFVKKCDPPREAVKFIVTHPFLLTNMFVAGLCNDRAVLHKTHLLARITPPPIAYFSAITVYPGPFRKLIFLFTFAFLLNHFRPSCLHPQIPVVFHLHFRSPR